MRRSTAPPVRRGPAARLRIEPLETRETPALFTVTNLNNSGAGSLAQAILDANSSATADQIVFDTAGVFATPRTITLTSELPTISNTGALTITGPGADRLTVARDTAGSARFRVLTSLSQDLTLSGFKITGGDPNNDNGGGLRQEGGRLTLTGMAVVNNKGSSGGGIYLRENVDLLMRDSTVSGNQAERSGGGVYFFRDGGFLIENSTISGNSCALAGADRGGGGLYFSFGGSITPPLTIRNSTIANNTSAALGGGLFLREMIGILVIENCTITGNVATTTTAGRGGGGLSVLQSETASVRITNSVVSGNTNANGPDIRIEETPIDVNYSAVGSSTGFTLTPTSGNNLPFGANLQLGALGPNGGPTQTRLPAATSPLIDAGSDALVAPGVTTDQRGPGFVRTYGAATDIGAVERQPPSVTINRAAAQADPTNTGPITFTVAFSVPVTGFTAADVNLTGSTAGGTLLAAVAGSGANYTVTVTGMTTSGNVVASVPAGAAVDTSGVGNDASTSTDNVVGYDTDRPAVTIDRGAAQGDPANAGPILFDVLFSEPVTGFDAADLSLAGTTVGGSPTVAVTGSGASYTVSVSGMTGVGDVVASIPNGAALDAAGNLSFAATSTDNSVAYDDVVPTVTIDQAVGQADPTAGQPFIFTVTFSEPVTGFDAGDIDFTGSTVAGDLQAVVSGSGPGYTVTVSGATSDGLVVASLAPGAAADPAGNTSLASTSTDNSVILDAAIPSVTIDRGASQADPTSASPIVFDVHFSEWVTGFDVTDVDLSLSTVAGSLLAAVSGSGADYTVTVTGMSGTGTVVASIAAGAGSDVAGNLTTASTSTDNAVAFDEVIPTVTINQAAGQADPTNASPISFAVQFSEPVVGLDPADVSFAGSTVGGSLAASISGSGSSYVVTVTGMTGTGTVVASIPAGGVTDPAGNANLASTSTDNTVEFDGIVPTVTIDQLAGQADPTNGSPISFAVVFTEPVSGFDGSDVSLAGSTVGGTLVANVAGTGDHYTVTVTGMFGRGTVVASIPAGAAADAAGNGNTASTSTDNVVVYDNIGTLQFESAVSTATEDGGTATITVTRTGGDDGLVTIDYAATDGLARAGSDYTLANGTLSWAHGESGSKSFVIGIVQEEANEGWEDIALALTNPTGGATTGLTTARAVILPSDPKGPGTFFDSDGDGVTLKLSGPGQLAYYLSDPDGDGKGPIDLLELTGTDPLKSSVTLKTKKASATTDGGRIALGSVTGPGLKSLSASKADLVGSGFGLIAPGIRMSGYLGSLTVGDVRNGADIIAGAAAGKKTKVTAGVIGDGTTIDLHGPLTGLSATSIGAGSVTAPSIGTMTVKGNLAADVTVSGAGVVAGKPALATLKATGAVSGDITVSGLLNAVQTGGFNGTLTAGWVGSMSVKGDLNGPVTLTGSGLPTGKVALRSLTVTGAVRPAGTVTAPSIGTLSVTGDLGADVTISGAGVAAGKAALNSLKVKGAVTGRDIRVGGNVTSVSAGRFLDSRLFAGYDGPDDGGGAFSATPATVKSFRVTGATDAFANSTVIAAAFKAVTLQSVRGENGDDLFGFVANDSIGSLKVASLAFAYDPFLTLPQGFDDFEVKVL